MKTFKPYSIKDLTLINRIVMPPMCMYSAEQSGKANAIFISIIIQQDAIGGVGLIIVEATGVTPNGRISDQRLRYLGKMIKLQGLKKIVHGVKQYNTKIAIQLNHGGRKYEGQSGDLLAPSPIPF